MEKVNVKLIKTSKNYAAALFETAYNQGIAENVLNDLALISETISENSELETFLDKPVIKTDDKKSAVYEIFNGKINQITMNLLFVLADNARFDAVYNIKNEYKDLFDESRNTTIVKATSAVEMKDYLKEKLKAKLENLLSKNVEIQYEINSDIIGGLIVEVNGTTIDNSVRTRLKNIRKQII